MTTTRRSAALERFALVVGAAFVLCAPLFLKPFEWADNQDWYYFEAWLEVARRTIWWWREAPLWNPYSCGGLAYWAHPQTLVSSPHFLLVLLFGSALGIKLIIVSLHAVALDGAYRLARDFHVEPEAAALAAICFSSGAWLTWQLQAGHLPSAGAAFFPYAWLALRRAATDWRHVLSLGACAAMIFVLGGTATPALAMVMLGIIALVDAIATRAVRPLVILPLAALVAFGLSAVHGLPVLERMREFPRALPESDSIAPWVILRSIIADDGPNSIHGSHYRFYEQCWRVVLIALPLIFVALGVRRARRLWIVAAIAFAISVGDWLPHGPWSWLRQLPVFSSLRVPSRYTLILQLVASLLAALALSTLMRARGGRFAKWAWVVVAIAAVDGTGFVWRSYHKLFYRRFPTAGPEVKFQQVSGVNEDMLAHVLMSHGSMSCWEDAPMPRAEVIELDDVPQVRLAQRGNGRVIPGAWTPNRIEFTVDNQRPATVLINQNWDPHWQANTGEVVRAAGLLALRLSPGTHAVTLRYHPASFDWGVAVSTLSLLGCAWLWRRRKC